ncbi:unnamed protein product, partial [Dibothriocephalus latus]
MAVAGSSEQLPGLTSMLHRRRLRTLCRRCQYGRAAAALTKFYPQVVERYPELLVQLRCRQLVEMNHIAPMDVDSYPQSDGASKPDHLSPKSASVPLDVNGGGVGASDHSVLQNGCKNIEPAVVPEL